MDECKKQLKKAVTFKLIAAIVWVIAISVQIYINNTMSNQFGLITTMFGELRPANVVLFLMSLAYVIKIFESDALREALKEGLENQNKLLNTD